MNINSARFVPAFKAMTVHFGLSLLVAAIVAVLVFTLWFPYPYRELAGGRELFILVMAVDIVCGPILTFVLFSPTKPKKELITDISLIAVIQILALCYGIWTVWQVRPLFVVQEADRFNIISRTTIDSEDFDKISDSLKPKFFSEPMKVSLSELSRKETEEVNQAIAAGGKDRSTQPIFYIDYNGVKAYKNGHPLRDYLLTRPNQKNAVDALVTSTATKDINQLRYLYAIGREFWIIVINPAGEVVGYIESQ